MGKPLQVEVIAYAPTAFYHCMHCEVAWQEMGVSNRRHEDQLRSSLPQELIADYQAISTWVRDILGRHTDQVLIKVIDAASVEGFYKSLRYNVHRYPAVVVEGKARFAGSRSLEAAGAAIAESLAPQAVPT